MFISYHLLFYFNLIVKGICKFLLMCLSFLLSSAKFNAPRLSFFVSFWVQQFTAHLTFCTFKAISWTLASRCSLYFSSLTGMVLEVALIFFFLIYSIYLCASFNSESSIIFFIRWSSSMDRLDWALFCRTLWRMLLMSAHDSTFGGTDSTFSINFMFS